MSAIKNVTLIGGSGNLGSCILEKLLASKKFNVQVLKRSGSSSTFAAGIKVVEADYEDLASLTAAFQGQDAIVSAVSDKGFAGQKIMIDAAIAAGVSRFLPSEFGSNLTNPKCRELPVFGLKVATEEYLIEKSKTSDLTYSFIFTGGFIDYTLQMRILMDFSKFQPTLYHGGKTKFSATSMPAIGDAVVGVLTHPTETKNREVFVSEGLVSQNQLVDIAKKIAPNQPWNPVHADLDAMAASSKELVLKGQFDFPTILPLLLQSILDPEFGVEFTKNDNELLGIKSMSEEYLVGLLTPLIG